VRPLIFPKNLGDPFRAYDPVSGSIPLIGEHLSGLDCHTQPFFALSNIHLGTDELASQVASAFVIIFQALLALPKLPFDSTPFFDKDGDKQHWDRHHSKEQLYEEDVMQFEVR
jgi:hypothetical protein